MNSCLKRTEQKQQDPGPFFFWDQNSILVFGPNPFLDPVYDAQNNFLKFWPWRHFSLIDLFSKE